MKIAISGLSGVGSSSTAKLVSEKLDWPMYNFTFRALAQERGVAFEKLQEEAATNPEIDFELDRRLIEWVNQQQHCVIVTDLAIWLGESRIYQKIGLVKGADLDYKIWLDAPLEERAKRMYEREGGDFQQVKDYNHQRDLDNRARYLKLYGIDIFDHPVDWLLETSTIPLEQVVELIYERVKSLTG